MDGLRGRRFGVSLGVTRKTYFFSASTFLLFRRTISVAYKKCRLFLTSHSESEKRCSLASFKPVAGSDLDMLVLETGLRLHSLEARHSPRELKETFNSVHQL